MIMMMWWSKQRDGIRLYSCEQVVTLMEIEDVSSEVRNLDKLDKFNVSAY